MNSEKQNHVLNYLKTVESATLDEIYKAVPFGYYANGNKHLGDVLSRMVKNKQIVMVRKGVFKINTGSKDIKDQLKLEL